MAGASIIALAGAGGDLGGRIAKALVARGATVHALVRPGLKSDEAQRIEATGATLVEADPANISAMATACAGASCVVSALNGVRKVMIDRQSVLLEGAVKAGVPRFIPSDYSADFTRTRPGDNRNFDLRREFMAVVDRAPVKATSVLNGAFMDMLGAEMPIIQPSIRRVLYWQDADQPLDFTTKDDTAGYVAAVAMDDNTPRILRIAGDVVSARDIARTMGEVTGERYRTLWAGSNAMLGAMTTVPSWSPDGREIAYLKRVGGRTQAWRVAADGGGGAVVTDAPVDVEDVAWSADGMRLVFATRPGRIAFAAAARGEAREGYLFDDRVLPPNGPAPQLPADLPRAIWAVPRLGGVALAAAALDVARLSGERPLSVPYPLDAVSAAGRRAGADRVGPNPFADRQLWAQNGRGRVSCAAVACAGAIRAVWWRPDDRAVLFLRYEGWNNELTALYRWIPGSAPSRVLSTDAALLGCTMGKASLLCLRETSLMPRQIISVSLADGAIRTVYDPNPEFASLARPRVERSAAAAPNQGVRHGDRQGSGSARARRRTGRSRRRRR